MPLPRNAISMLDLRLRQAGIADAKARYIPAENDTVDAQVKITIAGKKSPVSLQIGYDYYSINRECDEGGDWALEHMYEGRSFAKAIDLLVRALKS